MYEYILSRELSSVRGEPGCGEDEVYNSVTQQCEVTNEGQCIYILCFTL